MGNLLIKTHGEEDMNLSLSQKVIFSKVLSPLFFINTFMYITKFIGAHNESNHNHWIIYIWEVRSIMKYWTSEKIVIKSSEFSLLFFSCIQILCWISLSMIIWVVTNHWRLWERNGNMAICEKVSRIPYTCVLSGEMV